MPLEIRLPLRSALTPDLLALLQPILRDMPRPYIAIGLLSAVARHDGRPIGLGRFKCIGQADVDRHFDEAAYTMSSRKERTSRLRRFAYDCSKRLDVPLRGLAGLKSPRVEQRGRCVLSKQHVIRLLTWPRTSPGPTTARVNAMAAVISQSGARFKEVAAVQRRDYDAKAAAITFRCRAGGWTIPLLPLTVDLIERYLEEVPDLPGNELLFPDRKGGKYHRAAFSNQIRSRAKTLGIDVPIGTTELRETFKAMMSDADAVVVAALMGLTVVDMAETVAQRVARTRSARDL